MNGQFCPSKSAQTKKFCATSTNHTRGWKILMAFEPEKWCTYNLVASSFLTMAEELHHNWLQSECTPSNLAKRSRYFAQRAPIMQGDERYRCLTYPENIYAYISFVYKKCSIFTHDSWRRRRGTTCNLALLCWERAPLKFAKYRKTSKNILRSVHPSYTARIQSAFKSRK